MLLFVAMDLVKIERPRGEERDIRLGGRGRPWNVLWGGGGEVVAEATGPVEDKETEGGTDVIATFGVAGVA
jgi:hypothetical protein